MKAVRYLTSLVGFAVGAGMVFAAPQPDAQPGDIFKEYKELTSQPNATGMLRVGGQLDYGGHNRPAGNFDLTDAVRAEVIIEKVLCHGDSRTPTCSPHSIHQRK